MNRIYNRVKSGASSTPIIGKPLMPWAGLAIPLIVAACAGDPCPSGSGGPVRIHEIYFGRGVSGRGPVTDAEWRAFRDEVITPALPDGYTILDGAGSWRNPRTDATVSETTKILAVATPDNDAGTAAVNHIRRAWEARFHQYVAGMTMVRGCGSFTPEPGAKDR